MARKRRWSISAIATGIALMTALGVANTPFAAENVLKIGVASAQTGFGKAWGIATDNAARIWRDRYNSQGGIQIGDQKYKIELIFGDTRYEPALARTVGEKLIYRDKVKYILTPGMPIGGTIEGMARREGVLVLENSSSGAGVAPEHTLYFDTLPYMGVAFPPYFGKIKEQIPNVKRLARITIDEVWDRAYSEQSQEALDGLQPWAEWVGEVVFERGVTDYMPTVTGVLAKNPDIISLGEVGTHVVPIIKVLRELGYDGPIINVNAGFGVPGLVQNIQPNTEYLNNTFWVEWMHHPFTPELEQYKKEYEQYNEWQDVAVIGGMPTPMLLEAFKKAGSIEVDKVLEALEDIRYKNWMFPGENEVSFGGENTFGIKRMASGPVGITTIENGEPKTIASFMAVTP